MADQPYKNIADHLASKGRYGDTMLVHMNPYEVQGLASMAGGKLTINPDTGQPEAFLPFLLPLLGGFAGSAFLPGAIAGLGLGTISATLGGALGAGAASTVGGLIEGKDIGTALGKGVASGLLSYGLGSAMEGLAGAGEAAAGGADAATSAAAAAPAAGSGAEAAAGGVQDWVPQAMGQEGFKYANIDAALQANAPPSGIGGMMSRYGDAARNLANPEALKSTFIDNFSKTTLPIGLGLYGQSLDDTPQSGEPYPTEPYYGPASTQGTGRVYTPKMADSLGYEQSYFRYADGGDVKKGDDEEYADYKEWIPMSRMPQAPSRSIYGAMRDKRERDKYDELYGKIGPLADENPFTRRQPPVGRYARGGGISGPGGGLDDAIPAIIDGRQPALLSSGEYVIPAHAVSGLGNGSTEEGIRQLDGFVDRLMESKYGGKERQPNPVDPAAMMAELGDRMDHNGSTYESLGYIGYGGPGADEYRSYLESPEGNAEYLKMREMSDEERASYPQKYLKGLNSDSKKWRKDKNGLEKIERWRRIDGYPTS